MPLAMLLKRYLRIPKLPRLSQRRAKIDAKARELIAKHGDDAYYVARDLKRTGRRIGAESAASWAKVAARISRLTDRKIEPKGSDRWPGP